MTEATAPKVGERVQSLSGQTGVLRRIVIVGEGGTSRPGGAAGWVEMDDGYGEQAFTYSNLKHEERF